MDSFKSIKRRATDLLQSVPQNLPAMPSLGGYGRHGHGASLKGTWEKISVPPLPRSSHSVDIVAGTVYIFGGEVEPRKPVDNDMHAVTLPSSGAPADYYAIKAKPSKPSTSPAEETDTKGKGKETDESRPELGDVPSPRVGHATAVIGHRIFLFGGRGGPDMTPLEEGGRVWVFDTRSRAWTYLDPDIPLASQSAAATTVTVPPARSYHSAVATEKPKDFAPHPTPHSHHHSHHRKPSSGGHGVGDQIRHLTRADSWRDWAVGSSEETGIPQRPIVGNVAERATDPDTDGYGTFIIHGGCLSDGSRTSDVWAFDVASRVWQRLPDAPGNPRGGTALALTRSRLYRFGGFNGKTEEGSQLDYLELVTESFHDASLPAGNEQEVAVSARHNPGWQSLLQGKENVGYKEIDPAEKPLTDPEGNDDPWPGPRSVASLEAITVGGGREYLVLMLGERDPSNAGHAAAGKFWDDVWAFQAPAQHMTAASLTDGVLSRLGRGSGEGRWTKVQTGPHDDEDDASLDGPGPRGWIASGTMGELEENGIVIWGGLDAGNKRLGDGWIFRLEP
ncbi:nitrile-specifier protein 2 [Naviculisporaceae sp. PSN 640]